MNGNHKKPPILVVDDEPEVLYSLRGLLRKEFDFHAAQSAYEAFQVLQQLPIQVVMVDQRMPGITGVDFLAQVRSRYPQVVRLIFTGYADIKGVIEAINKGHVFRYIAKPWDADDLRLILRQACDRYQQRVEIRELLQDLQIYLEECLPSGHDLETPFPDEAQVEREPLVKKGKELLERLDRVLLGEAVSREMQTY